MTIRSKPGYVVPFPVEVVCSNPDCQREWFVDDISDFRKKRGGATGRDLQDYPLAYIICPACGKVAYPVNGMLNAPLHKMVEDYERGGGSPGIKEVVGTRLITPFKVACANGKCHKVYEVTTLDGILWDDIFDRYYIICPNKGCGSKIWICDGGVGEMLTMAFLSIRWEREGKLMD